MMTMQRSDYLLLMCVINRAVEQLISLIA